MNRRTFFRMLAGAGAAAFVPASLLRSHESRVNPIWPSVAIVNGLVSHRYSMLSEISKKVRHG